LKLVLWLGLLAALFVSAMSLGGYFYPNLDAINHFRPFICAAFLLLALLAAFLRMRLVALGALALGLAHGSFLVAEIAPEIGVRPASASGPTLKLISYNMLDTRTDADGLARLVEREEPDVLVLVEAWPNAMATLDRVQELLPYRFDCFESLGCDITILSRLPLKDPKAWRPGAADPRVMHWTALAHMEVIKDGVPISLWATHLHWPYPAFHQVAEFANLKKVLADAGPNTILAGDFNSTPWSYALRRFDRAVPLERVTRAFPTWPSKQATFRGVHTIPAFGPVMPVDHVYLGEGLKAVDIRRGPYLGSDHYPVISRIALPR